MGAKAIKQAENRGESRGSLAPSIQRIEELELTQRYMVLGVLLTAIEHDIEIIEGSKAKFHRSYVSMLRGIQDRVLLDKAGISLRFRRKGIRILEESKGREGLRGSYLCRGYQHHFTLLWRVVQQECDKLLKSYAMQSS